MHDKITTMAELWLYGDVAGQEEFAWWAAFMVIAYEAIDNPG